MSTRRLGKGMLVIGSLVALALTGCTPSASDSSSPAVPTSSAPTAAGFSLSQGIDDNGFLVGIRALDFFDDLVYEGVVIPADVMTVSDEAVQAEIEILLADYQSSIEITDRPVQQGLCRLGRWRCL